jgi:hypothetical protein
VKVTDEHVAEVHIAMYRRRRPKATGEHDGRAMTEAERVTSASQSWKLPLDPAINHGVQGFNVDPGK